jgi:diguanylate cyclase (GGDEF)-like protein
MAEEFRTLAEQMPSAVFRVDQEGDISFGNAQWFTLIAACGPVVKLRDIVRLDRRAEVDEVVRVLVSSTGPDIGTLELPDAAGARVFSLTCRAVGEPGVGERSIIGAIRDVTATAQLRLLAENDQLTGVLNRHALDRCLDAALTERPDGVLLVFLDLDGFKEVNDAHGHDAGDLVLRTVAARLREAVRPSDDIGRYGGDEFVVVCHDVAPGAEVFIVDRVETAMKPPVHVTGGMWATGASIGIARHRAGDDAASLMQRADRSMYRTKRARRTSAALLSSGIDPAREP